MTPELLQLAGLWIYPVKSCAGHEVPWAQVTPQSGLVGDREWVMLTPDGRQAWMGEFHRMTLIRARLGCDGLVLGAPGLEDFHVPFEPAGPVAEVKMWNDAAKTMEVFPGVDAGDGARDWIAATIGQPFRLVRLGRAGVERQALLPLHIVSLPSWRELNRRLQAAGHAPVELERFRANLLIDGPVPFTEEAYSRMTWHGSAPGQQLEMAVTGRCVRCVMPNIDLATGEAGRQPLALIAAMSRERGLRAPSFGINAAALATGQLAGGMRGFANPT